MRIEFTKMQGAGNDYVYVDATKVELPEDKLPQIAEIVSDRHFGIGGDGLILIKNSDVADYRMQMFNADGSEGRMCGNGVRCVAKYVSDHGMVKGLSTSIETLGGIKYIDMYIGSDSKVNKARVDMGKPVFDAESIPVKLSEPFGSTIKRDGVEYNLYCLSMGNPHAVIFVDDPIEFDVLGVGAMLESDDIFPERCNIEFINVVSPELIQMRVFERGSGETLACGTGACAVAVACIRLGLVNNRVDVKLLGGTLSIDYKDNENVYMTGPCATVYKGEIDIDI